MNKIYNFEDYSAPTLSEQTADVELPWEDPHLICGATGKSCYMGMYCNCLCCKFEFISHARRINNRDYITRPLSPRIVTYCPHVKGAKALNLPWELVPGGFHRIQHYYPGKYFYVARKLDPRIVTYCAHVKGAKALNLPF